MTLTEIQNLSVDSSYPTLLTRLSIDVYGITLTETYADFVIADKPSVPDVEAELVIYKAELTVIENARLAEKARTDDLKSRFEDSVDSSAFHRVHPDIPNKRAFFKSEILEESDHAIAESRLSAIEAEAVVVQTEDAIHIIDEKRKKEYLSIEDQLDMIYHQGIDAWKVHILAVKINNPKS